MTEKRPPSDAIAQLVAWLAQQGYRTSAREIRTWRANKWLPPAIVEPKGYAQPTGSSNPPEAFDQALALAQIKGGKRVGAHLVTLALFARGQPTTIDQLRSAWTTYFASLQRTFDRFTERDDHPFDSGERLAGLANKIVDRTKSGRYMLRKIKRSDEAAPAVLQSALTVVLTGLLGGPVHIFERRDVIDGKSALDELHHATGMSGFVDDQVNGGGSIISSHEDLGSENIETFEHFKLSTLISISQTCSLEDFLLGRERLLVMLRFVRAFARTNAMTGGPSTGFGLSFVNFVDLNDELVACLSLLMVVIEKWMPGLIDDSLPMWRVEGDRHLALLELLKRIPKHRRRYFSHQRPIPWDGLSDELKGELMGLTEEFKREHPELALAITRPKIERETTTPVVS